MPKVYTKTGDRGKSNLNGKKIPKNHVIFHTLGLIDELIVDIGSLGVVDNENKLFLQIQRHLMDIASCISVKREFAIEATYLESSIDEMEEKLPVLNKFILPGTGERNVRSHRCRVTTRKVERHLVEMSDNPFILKYINRLSDYFFVLARYYTEADEEKEIIR